MKSSISKKPLKLILRWILPFLLLAGSFKTGVHMLKNRPRAKKTLPPPKHLLVETIKITPVTENVKVEAMGTVIPKRKIMLKSQVPGRIKKISPDFSPGKTVLKNSLLLEIEQNDYEIQLEISRNNELKAKAELNLEMGRYTLAQKEWELMKKASPDLQPDPNGIVLREPQLQSAKANLEIATAQKQKAELDLTRTRILMPFDGLILNKFTDIGESISVQNNLAEVVDTNEFWIETLIPADQLPFILFPNTSTSPSSVNVFPFTNLDIKYSGQVHDLLGQVDFKGRMAKIIISVKNPLSGSIPLLLDSYVSMEIEGKPLSEVFKIPREALRDGNQIWTVSSEQLLEIQQISILWKEKEWVFVEKGEWNELEIVVSDLTTPVPGIPVETIERNPS